MIERVVENWLISANERQYQIPFCQVLSAEGETVLYVSSHGVLEQGKDIITVGKGGRVRAYQLKAGKVLLKGWQDIKGEIDELVELPVTYPLPRSNGSHEPFLVTNGTVADSVINRIGAANKVWRKYNPRPLRLIQGNELVSRFVKAHGSFLPRGPREFGLFLELITGAGKEPFAKKKFASFLESILPIESGRKQVQKEASRAIASAVLMTSYIVKGCERDQNHWAEFEAWTVAASYILAIASKTGISEKDWRLSFDLCETAAVRALENLASECAQNSSFFTTGDPFTDGTFRPMRMIIIAGTLSALSLHCRILRKPWPHEYFLHNLLLKETLVSGVWGESAAPYLIAAALELEQRGQHAVAERTVCQYLNTVLAANETKGRGMPNLYYEPEDAYRLITGMDRYNSEIFFGGSYTAETVVEYLARRLCKGAVKFFWERITRIQYLTFRPKEEWEWFRWGATTGTLSDRMPNMPQSWPALLKESEGPPNVPSLLSKCPSFAPLFSVVFPQRFGVDMLRFIESALRNGKQSTTVDQSSQFSVGI